MAEINDILRIFDNKIVDADRKFSIDVWNRLKDNVPYRNPYLYKYRYFDNDNYNLNTLKKEQAWFSLVIDDGVVFTDCDDASIRYDIDKSLSKISINNFKICIDIIKTFLDMERNIIKDIQKNHRDNPLAMLLLQDQKDNRRYLSSKYNVLTRKKLTKKKYERVVKEAYKRIIQTTLDSSKKRVGVLSLTMRSDNEYMWKNYADNHKGFCIEYSWDDILYPILPIVYRKRGKINFSELFPEDNILPDDLLLREPIRFFVKKDIYKREEEMRVLADITQSNCKDYNGIRGFLMKCFKPHRVIAGNEISNENYEKLKIVCDGLCELDRE